MLTYQPRLVCPWGLLSLFMYYKQQILYSLFSRVTLAPHRLFDHGVHVLIYIIVYRSVPIWPVTDAWK